MHAAKVLLVVLIGGLLVAAGVFAFVPSLRPAFVKAWFQKASGFTPATSPEDALDKFKKALEKRDYEAAALYVTGDYKEFIDKGGKDAKELATAVDDLQAVMKTTGVKSDKVDYALFLLTPFPATFKIAKVEKQGDDKATAILDWSDDLARFAAVRTHLADWKINPGLLFSLMPSNSLTLVKVNLKQEAGAWKIVVPAEITGVGGRHVRDSVEALRKNATNYKNALNEIKTDIKNNPATKEDFERSVKVALEKSN